MAEWDDYPINYRAQEVQVILGAVRSGECVSVVGLSGAGKSNLLGFLAHREEIWPPDLRFVLVDLNRLSEVTSQAVFRLVRLSLGDPDVRSAGPMGELVELAALDRLIGHYLESARNVCLLLDRFDVLANRVDRILFSNLRALRDEYKYRLTYVAATRKPLDTHTEMAELFYAHCLWLAPLNESDARWSVARYAARKGLVWEAPTVEFLIDVSGGYPALLRAVCEAYAAGARLSLDGLRAHPAVQKRLSEFWADRPDLNDLRQSGLDGHPLLGQGRAPEISQSDFDTSQLTAKEHRLLEYFLAHPNEVCEKDDLIRAVWPEDKVFERGIRDDSLAQLVRRLRVKIEPDPSSPRYIQTVTGRGYQFRPAE